jgi:shikimate kinase
MMTGQKSNIILIGMPGAGKSTIGVLLAKELSMQFVDTDLLIQQSTERSLQSIVDSEGYLKLRQIEETEILKLDIGNSVIATGGSAVYSENAIEHLRKEGILVYLKLGVEELIRRISNYETRGIAKRKDQSFSDLFRERTTLYEKYCDMTIDCEEKNHDQVVKDIINSCGTEGAYEEFKTFGPKWIHTQRHE